MVRLRPKDTEALETIDNVSLLKTAKERVRLSDRILEASPDHISVLSRDYVYKHVNAAYLNNHGVTAREIVGKHVQDLLGDDLFLELVKPNLDRCLSGEEVHYEAWFDFKLTGKRHMSVSYLPMWDKDNLVDGVMVLSRDITDRRIAEENLKQSEERFRKLFQKAGDAIFILKEDGKLLDVNRQACDALGYTREELIELSVPDIAPEYDPERVRLLCQTQDENDGLLFESHHRRKNGTLFPVEVRLASFISDGVPRVVAHVRDITKRKASIEAKSEFLASMGHELRTPLNAIIGFAGVMLAETFGPINNNRYVSYAADIHTSGRDLLELVNDILEVSDMETGDLKLQEKYFDVEGFIKRVARLAAPLAERHKVVVGREIPAGLPKLYADDRRLRQVLLNLLGNGIKFSNAGDVVRLSVQIEDDGCMSFLVSDQGIGMDEVELEKAMGHFSQVDGSLSRKYSGPGLGLPMSKALTELHDGVLRVESQKESGTTVTVTFPKTRVFKS